MREFEIAIENFSIYRKDRSEVKGGRAGGVIVYVRVSVISFQCEKLNIVQSLSGVR